jgi:hypothetical protein
MINVAAPDGADPTPNHLDRFLASANMLGKGQDDPIKLIDLRS